MKYMIFFFIGILSVSLFSQSSKKSEQMKDSKIETAMKSYEVCLKHSNEGVVESAIANVLRFKHLHPDANWENIEILLDELSKTSNSARIQKRAYLVLQIMKDPALVSRIEEKFFRDVDQFFEILAIGTSLDQTDAYLVRENVSETD